MAFGQILADGTKRPAKKQHAAATEKSKATPEGGAVFSGDGGKHDNDDECGPNEDNDEKETDGEEEDE